MKDGQSPLLRGSSQLRDAGWASIPVYGCGTSEIRIGKVRIEKPILETDIEDNVLWGIDILIDKNG